VRNFRLAIFVLKGGEWTSGTCPNQRKSLERQPQEDGTELRERCVKSCLRLVSRETTSPGLNLVPPPLASHHCNPSKSLERPWRTPAATWRNANQGETVKLDVEAKGWKVFGREVVLSMSPYKRAKSWEPLRGRNPTFAVGRAQKEAFREAVTVLRAFRGAHRAAVECWRRGVRDVLFPAGTWLMCWAHGALVAPA